MFGMMKRNIVFGIFLVGSNKTLSMTQIENKLNQETSYKSYTGRMAVKRAELETSDRAFEWVIDDDIIEDVVKTEKNTKVYKTLYDIAKRNLPKSFKGYGDDLVHTLATSLLLIISSVKDELNDTKPGSISIVIKVPKYVTMLLDKEAEDNNSINWLIDNNAFVGTLASTFNKIASESGYNKDVLTLLRWIEM